MTAQLTNKRNECPHIEMYYLTNPFFFSIYISLSCIHFSIDACTKNIYIILQAINDAKTNAFSPQLFSHVYRAMKLYVRHKQRWWPFIHLQRCLLTKYSTYLCLFSYICVCVYTFTNIPYACVYETLLKTNYK